MNKAIIYSISLIVAGGFTMGSIYAAPICINTVRKRGLVKLEHTGERKACAIIEDRDMNGPYWSPDEITRIKGAGIGPKWLEKIGEIKVTPEYRCWCCGGVIKLKEGDREGICPYCKANWPKSVHLKKWKR